MLKHKNNVIKQRFLKVVLFTSGIIARYFPHEEIRFIFKEVEL